MSLMDQVKERARANRMRILLPEGAEERTLQAARQLTDEKVAYAVLMGPQADIEAAAAKLGVSLEGIEVVDPATAPRRQEYVQKYYELRKAKGMTLEKAEELMKDPLWMAPMMILMGDADGEVSGAIHATGDVLRPALQIVRTAPGISVVSGAFIMVMPDKKWGDDGMIVFADCAVTPDPTPEQLGEIAVASARTAKTLAGLEPRVAMLSFSTKGSAEHPLVDRVRKATEHAKKLMPELVIDGEMQADAAIVPKVGASKAPGSPVAGKANVLIFPDLQSGNIGYKLVQRLAGAEAIGPFLQGMAAPINDLSRGCSVSDIVNVCAMIAVQAQARQ